MQLTPKNDGGGGFKNPFDAINPFKKKEESALSKGMDDLLKDAPLPVKMMGALAKPLIESVGSMMAEAADDQAEVLDLAERALRVELGDVRVGQVFGSSSSNINGQKVLSLQFTISDGSMGALQASGSQKLELTQLQVQDRSGRVIDVLAGGGSGGAGSDGVIDVDVL